MQTIKPIIAGFRMDIPASPLYITLHTTFNTAAFCMIAGKARAIKFSVPLIDGQLYFISFLYLYTFI